VDISQITENLERRVESAVSRQAETLLKLRETSASGRYDGVSPGREIAPSDREELKKPVQASPLEPDSVAEGEEKVGNSKKSSACIVM